MKTRYILPILAILLTIMMFGCGGGSSSDIAIDTSSDGDSVGYITVTEELNGTISENSETGVTIYESEEIEIKPGLLFKRSTVLTPKDPDNDQLGYSAMLILKFTNTTDSEETTKFIENIPKSFATHVDQLEYKALINESPNLTITDLLNDASSFVSIDDFVNKGYIEVLEEDPVLQLLLGGAAAIGTTYMIFNHPDKLGITSISTADDVRHLDDGQKKDWVEDGLLTENCSAISHSAETNNIPAKLLANIVLNEMADYGWPDLLQEVTYTGENRSHGWPQLQPQRIIDHGLIDIGSVDEVRDPTVDIVESDLTVYEGVDESGFPVLVKTPVNEKIWEHLVTPEPSIELAAREIAYLLDMFKKGSSVLGNPWAKALLKNPEEGIDRNNIYANLKVPPTTSYDPDERQIALDGTLALLVAAGYNGSGTIFNLTEPEAVFTADELKDFDESGYDGLLASGVPWKLPVDIFTTNPDTDKYIYPFADPRIHGFNAEDLFPKVLHESECLEETGLWTNYPNAEFCSMKEAADEFGNAFTININIEIPNVTFVTCIYYATGELWWEVQYRDSVADGYKKQYDEEGHVSWELYEDGQWIDTNL